MKRRASFLLVLPFLFFSACSVERFYAIGTPPEIEPVTPTVETIGDTLEEPPAPPVVPPPPPPPVQTRLSLTIAREIVQNAQADLVFLLDNSYSMSDNLTRLRNSLAELLGLLNPAAVDYKIRVLNFKMLKRLLQNPFAPQLFMDGKILPDFNYLLTNRYSVTTYDRSHALSDLQSAMNSASNIDTSLGEEFGLGLAMDYLNFHEKHLTPKLGQNVHMVVLSNEDNDTHLGTSRLYVSTQNNYGGTVTTLGQCQKNGWTTQSSVALKSLRSGLYYVRNDVVPSVGQSHPLTGISFGEYRCESAPDSFWSRTNYSSNRRICLTANQIRCPKIIDGITVWQTATTNITKSCLPATGTSFAPKIVDRQWEIEGFPVVDALSCRAVLCEKVVYQPSAIFTIVTSPSNVVTDIHKLDLPQGHTSLTPGLQVNLFSICPGQLAVSPLPEGLTLANSSTSQNVTTNFEYAAAQGMDPDDVKNRVATANGTTANQVQILQNPPDPNKTRAYAANVDDFLALIKDEHPGSRLSFHSVVSLDGQRCEAAQIGGEIEAGFQYMDLSTKTGGVIENICAANYDAFMAKLAEGIQYGPVFEYEISLHPGARIIEIKNVTRSLVLSPADFTALPKSASVLLRFAMSAPIGPLDEISILAEE